MKRKTLILATSLVVINSANASNIPDDAIIQFQSNTPARASEVNENFSITKGAINDNNSRIDSNISRIESLEGTNFTKYTDAEAVSAIQAVGVGLITNSLINTEFTNETSASNVLLVDGGTTSSEIVIQNTGIVNEIIVNVEVSNSDVSNLSIELIDPNDDKIIFLQQSAPPGSSLVQSWSDGDTTVSGTLSGWIGNSIAGNWKLRVIDNDQNNLGNDGEIVKWSIVSTGFSDSTATINGDLNVKGNLRVEASSGVIQMRKMTISRDNTQTIFFTAADGTTDTLAISNPAVAVTSTPKGLIAYDPAGADGVSGGSGDAVLLFNLSGASLSCTLLSSEDDFPTRNLNMYWATDGGNSAVNVNRWGNANTPTFMLSQQGVTGAIPLGTYQSHAIMCF